MNWADERYVRVYTRDTTDYVLWGWEAQALWWQLLRKFDRAGVLDLGRHGTRGLLAHVKMPWEFVELGLAELLSDGCVELHGDQYLVAKNYIPANESPQSDKARALAFREKHRDLARRTEALNGGGADNGVTERDAGVTKRDQTSRGRTSRNVASRGVTSRHSVPSVPCHAVPERDPDLPVGEPVSLSLLPSPPPPAPAAPIDLDGLYALYPRKEGRKKGIARAAKIATTPAKYEQLRSAIVNYAAKVRREGTEREYVKHFDTFMGCWEDYLPANGHAPRPAQAKKPADWDPPQIPESLRHYGQGIRVVRDENGKVVEVIDESKAVP